MGGSRNIFQEPDEYWFEVTTLISDSKSLSRFLFEFCVKPYKNYMVIIYPMV